LVGVVAKVGEGEPDSAMEGEGDEVVDWMNGGESASWKPIELMLVDKSVVRSRSKLELRREETLALGPGACLVAE
jgi:hypothetical protein